MGVRQRTPRAKFAYMKAYSARNLCVISVWFTQAAANCAISEWDCLAGTWREWRGAQNRERRRSQTVVMIRNTWRTSLRLQINSACVSLTHKFICIYKDWSINAVKVFKQTLRKMQKQKSETCKRNVADETKHWEFTELNPRDDLCPQIVFVSVVLGMWQQRSGSRWREK